MKRTLSVIALAGLLLTGCGTGTTEIERSDDSASPMISTPIVSTSDDTVDPSPAITSSPTTSSSAAPVESSATQAPVKSPNPLEPGAKTPGNAESTPTNSDGTWATMDVTVKTPSEASALTKTSTEFRAFIADRLGTTDSSGCQSEFTIQSYHPSGFAAGQDFAPGCGGSQTIWGIVGGQWETIMAMQTVVDCTEMQGNNIPKGIPDVPCLDAAGELVDW
ncbi:MAG: hypothetical protein Q4P15_03845 [Propionibacteriaceae bacterium]|nr:hypothetical protein [Propionibacteriaceae bacterium]